MENTVNKKELKAVVLECGDAVVTYRSQVSNKLKYNVCTLDFSTSYIKKKNNRSTETEDTLLMFCWDTDSYRLIKVSSVVSVTPLNLNNARG
jgi:hypothetical protein